MLQQQLVRPGVDLADDDRLARLDVRQQGVEQAPWARLVLARPQRLLEAREDPGDAAPPQPRDDLLHAPLEHPDVHLAGVHLRRAGAEREPVLAELPQRLEDQRALADSRLADEQHRAPAGVGERADERLHRGGAAADEDRRRAVGDVHDPAEVAEELDVDGRGLPLLERRGERGAGLDVGCLDQLADERLQAGGESVEELGRQGLAGRHARLEEAGDLAGERASAPVLLGRREDGRDDDALLLRERPQQELALAPVAALEPRLDAVQPLGRRGAPLRDRGERAGPEELGTTERELLERLVVDQLPGRRGAPRAG